MLCDFIQPSLNFLKLRSKFLVSILLLKNIDLFPSFNSLKYVNYEITNTNCFNIKKFCILSMIFCIILKIIAVVSPTSIESKVKR